MGNNKPKAGVSAQGQSSGIHRAYLPADAHWSGGAGRGAPSPDQAAAAEETLARIQARDETESLAPPRGGGCGIRRR